MLLAGLSIVLMVGMGDLVTRESFEWAAGYPNVTISCGKIACLMDDIAAFKVYSFIFLFRTNYNHQPPQGLKIMYLITIII